MPTKPTVGEEIDSYIERIGEAAEQSPSSARHLVGLTRSITAAGEVIAHFKSNELNSAEDTIGALAHILMSTGDTVLEMAEMCENRRAGPSRFRELLLGLLELSEDPDHGGYSTDEIELLRSRAREMLLAGV